MDYTKSLDAELHAPTGNAYHEDTKALPTVWSDKDANSIIWSLMEVVKAGGGKPMQFDKDVPASYQQLLKSLNGLSRATATGTTDPVAPPALGESDNYHNKTSNVIWQYFEGAGWRVVSDRFEFGDFLFSAAPVNYGTAHTLETANVTLEKGAYLVTPYSGRPTPSNAGGSYFFMWTARFLSGSGNSASINSSQTPQDYAITPFLLKVTSATAVIRFTLTNAGGSEAATVSNIAPNPLSFQYARI